MSDHLTMGRGHDNTSRVTASWLPVHRLPGCIIIAFLLASVIHEGSHYKCDPWIQRCRYMFCYALLLLTAGLCTALACLIVVKTRNLHSVLFCAPCLLIGTDWSHSVPLRFRADTQFPLGILSVPSSSDQILSG